MNGSDAVEMAEAERELDELVEQGRVDDNYRGYELAQIFAHQGIEGAANYLVHHTNLGREEAEYLCRRLYPPGRSG